MKNIFFLISMLVCCSLNAQTLHEIFRNDKYVTLKDSTKTNNGYPNFVQIQNDDNTDYFWMRLLYNRDTNIKTLAFDDNLNIVHTYQTSGTFKINDKFYAINSYSHPLYNNNIVYEYVCDSIGVICLDSNRNTLFDKTIFYCSDDIIRSIKEIGTKSFMLKDKTFLYTYLLANDSNKYPVDYDAMRLFHLDTLGNVLNTKLWLNKTMNTYQICETDNYFIVSKWSQVGGMSYPYVDEPYPDCGLYYLDKTTLEVVDSMPFTKNNAWSTNSIVCLNDSILAASVSNVAIINMNTKTRESYMSYNYRVPTSNGNFYYDIFCWNSYFAYKNPDSVYTCYFGGNEYYPNIFGGYLEILNFSISGDTNFVYRLNFESKLYKQVSGIKATNDGGVIISALGDYGSWLIKFMPNGLVSLTSVDNNNVMALSYPNPAKDNINFSCSELIEKIEIFNLLGQKVYEAKAKDKIVSVDVSSLVSGNYVAKLHTDKGVVINKFIVE